MLYTVLCILQYKQILSKQVEKNSFFQDIRSYKVIDETGYTFCSEAINMSWKILSEIQNQLQTDYEFLCILH